MRKPKFSLTLITIAVSITLGFTQQERSRTIQESWPNIKHVQVDHRHGILEVIPHSSSAVRLEAVIKVRANDADDAQTAVDHFDVSMDARGDRLVLTTRFETKNWITAMGNTRIRFKNGDKATGIKDLSINYRLHVPDLTSLELSNKYEDIVIDGDISGDLTVKQYSAEIRGESVGGNLRLDIKYGDASLASANDAVIDIYDSKLNLPEAENVEVVSKYSKYSLGNCTSLDIKSYDDEVKITSVSGQLSINDKYSDYHIGTTGSTNIQTYDTEVNLKHTGDHKGLSSYSTYVIGNAGRMDLEKSFDDEFEVNTLGSLTCTNSKYSEFRIQDLSGGIAVTTSFDDKINVRQVAASFREFRIDSKYTSVDLPLHNLAGYHLEATMKYGKLKYPEPSDYVKHIEKGDNLEINATIGKSGTGANVLITAYDSQIRLN